MNKKSILFFSCEPGGAEVLIPVIKLLEAQQHYSVSVVCYGFALSRFEAKGVDVIEIKPVAKGDFDLFLEFSPDMLITSATSLPSRDMSEKYLWVNARKAGVPSIAFLDQWQNYAIRFSGIHDDERLAYLPDMINCIDEVGRDEMIQEGFPDDMLVPMGHPYLGSLHHELANISRKLPLTAGCGKSLIHLFVSEALKEHFGAARGYDQYDVLKLLISHLEDSDPDSVLILKLHPKDERDCYERIIKTSVLDIRVFSCEWTPIECLAMADIVYGMSSIMLIEAYVLGRQVFSIQPNLQIEDPFVLTRQGILPCIDSEKDFAKTFDETKDLQVLDIEFNRGKFMDLLKRII